MNKKLLYSAPEAELLVVRFEGNFLTVSSQGNTIESASIDEWEDEL